MVYRTSIETSLDRTSAIYVAAWRIGLIALVPSLRERISFLAPCFPFLRERWQFARPNRAAHLTGRFIRRFLANLTIEYYTIAGQERNCWDFRRACMLMVLNLCAFREIAVWPMISVRIMRNWRIYINIYWWNINWCNFRATIITSFLFRNE